MNKLNKQEWGWVLYDCANSAYVLTITSTIMQLYFKLSSEAAGIPPGASTAYWGYANSLATVMLVILSPILGTIADYIGFKLKFFKIFSIAGMLFTFCIALLPPNNPTLLLAGYILSFIGFEGSLVFYDAFLVDVTVNERMNKVSTMGFAIGYIGSTLPFIICMAFVILATLGILPISIYTAYRIAFLITSVWWALFTIPILKNVRQKYGLQAESHYIRKSFLRLIDTFRNISKNKGAFLFLVAYFFYIDGVHTIITMATSFGSDLGIDSITLLIVLLVTQFVAFPFALLYGRMAEKFGAKRLIYLGIITYTLICIYAYFIKSVLDFWILALLVGTAQGGIQALSRSYFGAIIPKDNANEFFGFYNIFGKFAAILGPVLFGLVSHITGNSNMGVLSLIVLFIIGAVVFLFVPDISTDKQPMQ